MNYWLTELSNREPGTQSSKPMMEALLQRISKLESDQYAKRLDYPRNLRVHERQTDIAKHSRKSAAETA